MANFNMAIATVLGNEGGYVDNPADRGGPTNYGITQTTLDYWRTENKRPLFSVDQLSLAEAKIIYQDLYWTPLQLDAISNQVLATVCLDLAVLRGVTSIIKNIQLNCAVAVDGKMGPLTTLAFQRQALQNARSLALEIVLHAQYLCADFCVRNPLQLQFLDDWITRTQNLVRMVLP